MTSRSCDRMFTGVHVLLCLSSLLPTFAFSAELKAVTFQDALNIDTSEYPEGSNTALLFTIPNRCDDCHLYKKLMDDIASDALFNGDIFYLNHSTVPWIEKLPAPAILFLNSGRKIPYFGPLHRTHLVNAMHQFTTSVQAARLDDSNFEHDTQASTGSTTGNWIVIFDEISPETLQIYDGLSLTLGPKHVNIGVLDPSQSTRTAKRFNINIPSAFTDSNPLVSAILLKGSFMYRYSKKLHRMDYEKIIQFAVTDYALHTKSQIPRPRMLFDEIVDGLVAYTLSLQDEFGKPVVLMFGVIALFSFLIFIGLILVAGFWLAGSFEHGSREHTTGATTTTPVVPHEAGDDNKPKPVKKPKDE
uniref:Thioredoxin domain-containing protein n=1 Tax=Trichobilharzia regenti TaxID=157069 RepID=A0AA85K8T7_TRIRE|nr:unnamed protein product [Trichobilharzia regenti]